MADGGQTVTVPDQQVGLRRGKTPVPRCYVCTWRPEDRRRLIERVLDGATQRQLEKEFPASKTAIGNHLRECVPGEISRLRKERHRAIDWAEILDGLAQTGDDLASIIRNAAAEGDVALAINTVTKLSENVQTRIELADRVRKEEHAQLCQVVRELASAFVLNSPTKAPAIITEILEGRPCAIALLEDAYD